MMFMIPLVSRHKYYSFAQQCGHWDHQTRSKTCLLYPATVLGAATAINDNGQIVGISGICDQAVGRYTAAHAVLWENGGVTDIGNLGALFWNTPTAINQQGDIVGFAGAPDDPDGNFLQAFIWTVEDGMQPLGFLPGDVHSEAYGINEKRQVVGLSCDADGNCRAFIWENGAMQDLNDLKQAGFSATLETAKDINNKGEITGRALDPNTGVRTAYVAEPRHHSGLSQAGLRKNRANAQLRLRLRIDRNAGWRIERLVIRHSAFISCNRKSPIEIRQFLRGHSSVGRAPALQAGSQGFESPCLQSSLAVVGKSEDCRAGALAKADYFGLADVNAASYDSASQRTWLSSSTFISCRASAMSTVSTLA